MRADSDIEVEFQPEARVGLLDFAGLINELSELFGRKVDLVAKPGLKSVIREEVIAESRLVYAA